MKSRQFVSFFLHWFILLNFRFNRLLRNLVAVGPDEKYCENDYSRCQDIIEVGGFAGSAIFAVLLGALLILGKRGGGDAEQYGADQEKCDYSTWHVTYDVNEG